MIRPEGDLVHDSQTNERFLREVLPQRTWDRRLRHEGSLAFMEFGPLDVDRLQRLGIEADNLGPYLVVCMWDEESPLEIGGYLVVDNLVDGTAVYGRHSHDAFSDSGDHSQPGAGYDLEKCRGRSAIWRR